MLIFMLTVLFILAVAYVIFNPMFDCVPLYQGEMWYIMWYNKYTIKHWKIKVTREWTQLFYVDK